MTQEQEHERRHDYLGNWFEEDEEDFTELFSYEVQELDFPQNPSQGGEQEEMVEKEEQKQVGESNQSKDDWEEPAGTQESLASLTLPVLEQEAWKPPLREIEIPSGSPRRLDGQEPEPELLLLPGRGEFPFQLVGGNSPT